MDPDPADQNEKDPNGSGSATLVLGLAEELDRQVTEFEAENEVLEDKVIKQRSVEKVYYRGASKGTVNDSFKTSELIRFSYRILII